MQKALSKKEELAQMRYDMYKKMVCVNGVFHDLPLEQKLEYVQSAFNDVRDYCCKAWDIPNYMATFGFFIGQNSRALAIKKHGAVLYGVRPVVLAEKDTAAFDVYRTLFHEMAHIRQYNKITLGGVLADLVPIRSSSNGAQTSAQWLASQTETEADLVADRQMLKIVQEAYLKSTDKVFPTKLVEDRTFALRARFNQHVNGGFEYIKEAFKSLKGEKLDARVGAPIKGGPRLFNLRELQEVLSIQPIGAQNEFMEDFGEALRDYSYSHDDKAHQMDKFLDVNRRLNERASQQVLDNSPFIQALQEVVNSQTNEGQPQLNMVAEFEQKLMTIYPELGKNHAVEPGQIEEEDFLDTQPQQNFQETTLGTTSQIKPEAAALPSNSCQDVDFGGALPTE